MNSDYKNENSTQNNSKIEFSLSTRNKNVRGEEEI